MSRFIVPIILIGLSIAGFFMFTNPLYSDPATGIQALQTQAISYNDALTNPKALAAERDKLTQKYNSIDPANLSKLQTLLPDSVDNIRLILEIEKIASPYGMALTDVKYNATTDSSTVAGTTPKPATLSSTSKGYGSWDLQFSTGGSYSDFQNFLKDMESNLRIIDISSIQFSSDSGIGLNPSLSSSYKYSFSIKTYWLKN